MLVVLAVIAAAGVLAVVASYMMWWAAQRSGLWSLVMGVALGIGTLGGAILIGYLMTRAALRH